MRRLPSVIAQPGSRVSVSQVRRYGGPGLATRRWSIPLPTASERLHRGLARRFLTVRRCAILVVPEGQRAL
jgi:hypothetical protein